MIKLKLQSSEDFNYFEEKKTLKDNSEKVHDYDIRISKIVDQLLEQTRKTEAGEMDQMPPLH